MKRIFMLPGGKPLNDRVHHIEFEFEENVEGAVSRRAVGHDGRDRNHCPWTFRDVLSHVESGTMIEVLPDEDKGAGAYFEPSEYQLKLAAEKRVRRPDQPMTDVEGGAW